MSMYDFMPDLRGEDELEDPGPFCRVCGCSQLKACPGGCIWAEEDLCSRCAIAIAEVEALS